MNNPKDLKYTETDEWIKVEGNIATIGITDYAQDQLSDIVYLEYNLDVDDAFKKSDAIATIESVKAAAEVHAPVSGKIIETNDDLLNTPEDINNDPYGSWMFKTELGDTSELNDLMDAESYTKFCDGRGH